MRNHSLPGVIAAALVLMLGACMVGPLPENYHPAASPRGVEVDLDLRTLHVKGELLEVRDSALVVLTPREVALVHFLVIRSMRLTGDAVLYRGGIPSQPTRERLRLISRFPAGLAPEHLARLIQARGQQDVRVYRK